MHKVLVATARECVIVEVVLFQSPILASPLIQNGRYFTLRSVLLYHGGEECQWTLRYVVLNYLYDETIPC
jgi:hypothetical protein